MKAASILGAILASAAVTSARVQYEDGKYICEHENATYCAGDSLATDIIIRCIGKEGHPGRCTDNLVGEPPVGVLSAQCWQSSPEAGDAACEKNCVVYGSKGTWTLPESVCKPSHTATATSSSSSSSVTSSSKTHTSKSSATETETKTETKTRTHSSPQTHTFTHSSQPSSDPCPSSFFHNSTSTTTTTTHGGTAHTTTTTTVTKTHDKTKTVETRTATYPPTGTKTHQPPVHTGGGATAGGKAAAGALAVLGGFAAVLL